jgi:hypothetical protein
MGPPRHRRSVRRVCGRQDQIVPWLRKPIAHYGPQLQFTLVQEVVVLVTSTEVMLGVPD